VFCFASCFCDGHRVCTAPGKSWNSNFKFSWPWKLLEKDLSPGNSWKTPGIFMKYCWNFPDFPTFILYCEIHAIRNDHFSHFLLFGHAFSKLDQYCITWYTKPANFSRGSDTMYDVALFITCRYTVERHLGTYNNHNFIAVNTLRNSFMAI
jgi:hypothetical protein